MKVIDKVIEKMVKIDEDESALKMQNLRMLFEIKLPFMAHIKIEAEFKPKKKRGVKT